MSKRKKLVHSVKSVGSGYSLSQTLKEELGEDSEASSDEEISYRVITSISRKSGHISGEKKFQTNFRLKQETSNLKNDRKSHFNNTYISDLSGYESNFKNARISSIYSNSNFNTLLDENEEKKFKSVVKGSLPFDKNEQKYAVSIPLVQRGPPKKMEIFFQNEEIKTLNDLNKEKLLVKNKVNMRRSNLFSKNLLSKLKQQKNNNHSFNGSGSNDTETNGDVNESLKEEGRVESGRGGVGKRVDYGGEYNEEGYNGGRQTRVQADIFNQNYNNSTGRICLKNGGSIDALSGLAGSLGGVAGVVNSGIGASLKTVIPSIYRTDLLNTSGFRAENLTKQASDAPKIIPNLQYLSMGGKKELAQNPKHEKSKYKVILGSKTTRDFPDKNLLKNEIRMRYSNNNALTNQLADKNVSVFFNYSLFYYCVATVIL